MLLRNIKHLVINIRREGGLETFKKICFRFFRVNSFYVFSLDLSHFNLPVLVSAGTRVMEVMQKELLELREHHSQLPSEFYIDKLEPKKKHRSFVCFVDDIPALILWLCEDQSSGFVKIGSKSVEMNHIRCRQQFRGGNLLQNTLRVIALKIREEGYCEIVTVVHSSTIACIKPLERCGFKRSGVVKRLGLIVWRSE